MVKCKNCGHEIRFSEHAFMGKYFHVSTELVDGSLFESHSVCCIKCKTFGKNCCNPEPEGDLK